MADLQRSDLDEVSCKEQPSPADGWFAAQVGLVLPLVLAVALFLWLK